MNPANDGPMNFGMPPGTVELTTVKCKPGRFTRWFRRLFGMGGPVTVEYTFRYHCGGKDGRP